MGSKDETQPAPTQPGNPFRNHGSRSNGHRAERNRRYGEHPIPGQQPWECGDVTRDRYGDLDDFRGRKRQHVDFKCLCQFCDFQRLLHGARLSRRRQLYLCHAHRHEAYGYLPNRWAVCSSHHRPRPAGGKRERGKRQYPHIHRSSELPINGFLGVRSEHELSVNGHLYRERTLAIPGAQLDLSVKAGSSSTTVQFRPDQRSERWAEEKEKRPCGRKYF